MVDTVRASRHRLHRRGSAMPEAVRSRNSENRPVMASCSMVGKEIRTSTMDQVHTNEDTPSANATSM